MSAPAAKDQSAVGGAARRTGFQPVLDRLKTCPTNKGRGIRRTKDSAMRRIAILNQKGGVGKTTTAVNLGAALARLGRRVCVLDLDPQAHATTHLGVEPDGKQPSMYDVLVKNRPIAEAVRPIADNLWLAGADINLAAAEVELAGVVGREVI